MVKGEVTKAVRILEKCLKQKGLKISIKILFTTKKEKVMYVA